MTALSDVSLLNYYILQLSLADTKVSPSDILEWAEAGILFDKMVERGKATGVDVSSVPLHFGGERGRVLGDNLASWANVISPSRKYGMPSDGSNGWHALLFGLIDQFYGPYGKDVEVTW